VSLASSSAKLRSAEAAGRESAPSSAAPLLATGRKLALSPVRLGLAHLGQEEAKKRRSDN